jgi:hypothetical protein
MQNMDSNKHSSSFKYIYVVNPVLLSEFIDRVFLHRHLNCYSLKTLSGKMKSEHKSFRPLLFF